VFERYALRDKLRPFFERYDILLSPVLPVTALDVGKNRARSSRRSKPGVVGLLHLSVQSDRPAAATVCAGIASDGMPVGLQIVGRAFDEVSVVRAAAAYERSQPKGYNVRAFIPPT
jgi:aspartyl-tRNA(Asn)/glutamyl-tRNA(Gln) amidotransferase subunit A